MPPNVHRKAYLVCLILIAGVVLSVPAFSDPPLLVSAEANSPLHPGDELRIIVVAHSLNQVNWFEAQVIGPAGTVKSFSQAAEFEPVGVDSWTYTARWQLPAWLGPGSYSVSRLRVGASTSQSHAQIGSSGGRLHVTQRNLQYSEFWPPFSFEIISGAAPDVAAEISGETPEPRYALPAPAATLPVYPGTTSLSPAGSVSPAPVPDSGQAEVIVAVTPEPLQTSSSPDMISLDSLVRGLISGSAGPLPQAIPAIPTVPQPTATPVVQSPAAAPLSLIAGPEPVATGAVEQAPAVPAQPATSIPVPAGTSDQILPAATVSPRATPATAPAQIPTPLSLPVPGPEPVLTGVVEPAPAVPAQPAASAPALTGASGSVPAMAINISIPGNGSFTGLPPFPVEIPLSLPVATPATPVPTKSPGVGSPSTSASDRANQDNLPAATGNGTRVSIRELIKQANITLEESLKVDRSAFLHGNLTMGMTDLPGSGGMMGTPGTGNDIPASPDGRVDRINLTMDESPGIDSTLRFTRNITIVPAGEAPVPQWDAGQVPPGTVRASQAGLQP
jgi:hypothetical protein